MDRLRIGCDCIGCFFACGTFPSTGCFFHRLLFTSIRCFSQRLGLKDQKCSFEDALRVWRNGITYREAPVPISNLGLKWVPRSSWLLFPSVAFLRVAFLRGLATNGHWQPMDCQPLPDSNGWQCINSGLRERKPPGKSGGFVLTVIALVTAGNASSLVMFSILFLI